MCVSSLFELLFHGVQVGFLHEVDELLLRADSELLVDMPRMDVHRPGGDTCLPERFGLTFRRLGKRLHFVHRFGCGRRRPSRIRCKGL